MAEEDGVVQTPNGAEGNEGIQVPGEGGSQDPTNQNQAPNYEEIARKKGWSPKEDFQGDEDDWVPAEEFVKREPLFDRIKSQSKELKSLRKTVEAMVSQHQKQVDAGVKLKIKELQAEKRKAIELGDVDAVEEIEAQIDEQKEQTVPQSTTNSEVTEWVDKNPWFKTDPELNSFAVAMNKVEFEKTGDVMKSLENTKKAVMKAFPEKFESKPRTTPDPVAGDNGDAKGGGGDDKRYSVSRLNPEQKLVYNQYVKVSKIMSHEEYFKGLEEIGELQ
jgi:hypothetical protein